MTWEILMGLLTLVSALAGLAKTITNNTRALTEIRCTVSALNDTVLQQRKDLRAIREQMQDLTVRVHDLERGYDPDRDPDRYRGEVVHHD